MSASKSTGAPRGVSSGVVSRTRASTRSASGDEDGSDVVTYPDIALLVPLGLVRL